MEQFRVASSLDRSRLDVVLATHPKISSRAEAQRHIRAGVVRINESGERVTPKRIIRSNDLITFTILPQPASELRPVPFDLDIRYEDPYLLVVNKPRGVVVHPAAGHSHDTLVNYLLHHTTLSGMDPVRPGIVHRIDRDTSGLLVIAKDQETHEHLARQFHEHTVLRVYQAIIWGVPDHPHGVIDKPLGRHPKDRKKYTIRENGKHAVTRWKVVKPYQFLSLITCRLETGRTHQIRVHLSSIGHPLLGDAIYGSFRNFSLRFPAELRAQLKAYHGQALHAGSLGFVHPKTGAWMEHHSDLPDQMASAISALERFYG